MQKEVRSYCYIYYKQWGVGRFWTGSLNKIFALNTPLMSTEYDSGLLVWSWFSEVMFFSLVLLQWDLDSSMHLLGLVKLTTSRTVWLIWWFLNTLANLMMNPADYFQHMAVCFVFHSSWIWRHKALTHLYGPPMANFISYGELLIWSGLWNLPLHILIKSKISWCSHILWSCSC